jgi:hypothetical protein
LSLEDIGIKKESLYFRESRSGQGHHQARSVRFLGSRRLLLLLLRTLDDFDELLLQTRGHSHYFVEAKPLLPHSLLLLLLLREDPPPHLVEVKSI